MKFDQTTPPPNDKNTYQWYGAPIPGDIRAISLFCLLIPAYNIPLVTCDIPNWPFGSVGSVVAETLKTAAAVTRSFHRFVLAIRDSHQLQVQLECVLLFAG